MDFSGIDRSVADPLDLSRGTTTPLTAESLRSAAEKFWNAPPKPPRMEPISPAEYRLLVAYFSKRDK